MRFVAANMELLNTAEEMCQWSADEREAGRRIAFVPTMGALHDGHIALLEEGKRRGDKLIVSIYVNPTQFGPGEDFDRYPRELERDLEKCRSAGVDAVFCPTDAVMYPDGFSTTISVSSLSKRLCGASRPGHFDGVTTVVSKLFNITEPDIAIFGEKDFQQLVVIRRMTRDLNLPVEIVGIPTVRESDGLAVSSRNRYLAPSERPAALSLSKSLSQAGRAVRGGEQSAKKILAAVTETIRTAGARLEYANIVDPETLDDVDTIEGPSRLCLAAFVGKTRLIDNCQLP